MRKSQVLQAKVLTQEIGKIKDKYVKDDMQEDDNHIDIRKLLVDIRERQNFRIGYG